MKNTYSKVFTVLFFTVFIALIFNIFYLKNAVFLAHKQNELQIQYNALLQGFLQREIKINEFVKHLNAFNIKLEEIGRDNENLKQENAILLYQLNNELAKKKSSLEDFKSDDLELQKPFLYPLPNH